MPKFLRQPRKTFKRIFGIPQPQPPEKKRYEHPLVKGSKAELDPDIFNRLPLTFHKTELGNFYVPAGAKDDIVAREMKYGRIFEPHVVKVAEAYAKPGTLLLDIGANFGQMSVLFSRLVGKDGIVFSFEAQEYCFAILQKNLLANNCENVRAFYGAVMETGGGEVSFPEPDLSRFDSYGSHPLSLEPPQDVRAKVKTLAIDDLKIEFPISFCKIDTQGSDIYTMRGMRETIAKHRMPILFEYEERFQEEFKTSFQDYVDFVASIDYRFVKTIADINFLILPAPAKTISTPAPAAVPATDRVKEQDIVADTHPAFLGKLCKILKNVDEVTASTNYLHENGYFSHLCTPKDWDLAHILPHIGDGNIIDLGSSDSYILRNVCLKKTKGKKYGIDLRDPTVTSNEITYFKGDLLHTGLPDGHLTYATCLSVVEHQVDFVGFAKEVGRLLVPGGKLFVTVDYWDPLLKIPIKAYDLDWQPLDRPLMEKFINECARNGLNLVQAMDWTEQDALIRGGYYSPHPDVTYTFAMAVFEKA